MYKRKECAEVHTPLTITCFLDTANRDQTNLQDYLCFFSSGWLVVSSVPLQSDLGIHAHNNVRKYNVATGNFYLQVLRISCNTLSSLVLNHKNSHDRHAGGGPANASRQERMNEPWQFYSSGDIEHRTTHSLSSPARRYKYLPNISSSNLSWLTGAGRVRQKRFRSWPIPSSPPSSCGTLRCCRFYISLPSTTQSHSHILRGYQISPTPVHYLVAPYRTFLQ